MNKPKLERCPHCEGEVVVRWFYEYEALQCDNCGMIFALPQHGCGNKLHDAFNRRTTLPDNKALTIEKVIAWGAQIIECETDAHVTFCTECGFPITDYGSYGTEECYCSWCKAKNTSHNYVAVGPGYCTTSIDRKAKTFDKVFSGKRRPPEKGE